VGAIAQPSPDGVLVHSRLIARPARPARLTRPRRLSVQRPYAMLVVGEPIVPTPSATRDDRIELRASREEKRVLAAAAAYERLDLTSFVMRSALPAAEEIVARHERITLSARDSARVLNLLEHPPRPTAALRTAAKRRRNRR
jgi:uncharacterized protein (DUF1778 family)